MINDNKSSYVTLDPRWIGIGLRISSISRAASS